MLKPRPSPNLGKCTSTRDAPASSPATLAGSSAGSSRSTFSSGERGCVSLATRRPMISLVIDPFLERLHANTLHDVDEAFHLAVPVFEVALDQFLDDVGHLRPGEGRSEDLAQGGAGAVLVGFSLVPADLDLVPLFAVLIDAEDADMADVVVAAGVHAARDVEVELADVEELSLIHI